MKRLILISLLAFQYNGLSLDCYQDHNGRWHVEIYCIA